MSQPWETSVVRIFARDGDRPMGAGVLVGKRLVLTCSHVVNAVLDREVEKRPPAEALLDVDFPSLSDVRIGATLRPGRWSDPLPADENFRAGADLALLDLDPLGSLETVVQAVEFSDDWAYDNESASFGFPDKALDGDTAKGRLGSRLAGGSLIEIKSDNAAVDSIQEGYSGTALWAKRGDQWIAVGLVVRMQDDWRGRAQRATAISLAFPDEIRLAAARPRGGPARLSDLHGHMGLVDREPQVSKIKSSLKLVREKQAPCAQFFTVSCVADDLPDLLRDRFGSEKTIATAAGEAVLVDWPGPMSSSAAEVGNLRDTIANALAFDDSRAPDAAAIADRLNAGDRPRIYISVLRQRQFTARQRETVVGWARFWSGLDKLGKGALRAPAFFILVTVIDGAPPPPSRWNLRGLLGRRESDPAAELAATIEELKALQPNWDELPPLDECRRGHLRDWLDERVLPKLAAQLPELRIRLFQALEAENFRLRQLETIILRKDDA